jgi:hypothetical protein
VLGISTSLPVAGLGTEASLNVGVPSGAAAGNYAIAWVCACSGIALSPSSGWTTLSNLGATGNNNLTFWGKQLDSADITSVFKAAWVAAPPGTGNPWYLSMLICRDPLNPSIQTYIRSFGCVSTGNTGLSATATTNSGGLAYPPGPWAPPPQVSDSLAIIAVCCSPQGLSAPPSHISLLSAYSPIRQTIGTIPTFFGANCYLELFVAQDYVRSGGAGNQSAYFALTSITPGGTPVNGLGVAIIAFYPPGGGGVPGNEFL